MFPVHIERENTLSLAFNDAALMTAVSNDIDYAESFAMPMGRFVDPGPWAI